MQKMIPALTDRQRYWLEQIQACEASGKSIAEYATEHGGNVRAMYSGKKILVNKGVLPAIQPTRFQRVQLLMKTGRRSRGGYVHWEVPKKAPPKWARLFD